MKHREILKTVRGQRAVDGAGVSLVRVLGNRDVYDFDPFLMLDSFDSTDPAAYTAGFPWHPHRGIETITYLINGKIEHMDSLGNKGTIESGESQWMTAGSGILHQEMPMASEHMLGLQLWLNLPKSEKLSDPAYLGITQDMMPVMETEHATVRVLSGSYGGITGITPRHIQAGILDVSLKKNGSITMPTKPDETVFVFLITGDAVIDAHLINEKTAILFGAGDSITIEATPDRVLRFLLFSGKALHEPIAWGGPIVMNTREELDLAFDELRKGTFIKHNPSL
ncbi:MAG: pirin family protein [Clostridiales bacterium]|nr:pirin family protein [Clostridiales bacterium]